MLHSSTVLYNLPDHFAYEDHVILCRLGVRDIVPGQVQVLKFSIHTENFQHAFKLSWQKFIPADIQAYESLLRFNKLRKIIHH